MAGDAVIHHLAARAFLMVGEGATLADAVEWVTRRIDRNLREYYWTTVYLLVCAALAGG